MEKHTDDLWDERVQTRFKTWMWGFGAAVIVVRIFGTLFTHIFGGI